MNEARLNKIISHNSKYSRREADELIKAGKIKVDGKIVTNLSTKVDLDINQVHINNKLLHKQDSFSVIVYHKLKGELVTKKDDRDRKTIYDTLPKKFSSFIPIGRLDFASEGLLLLTDSPNIANQLMTSNLERVYYLKINSPVNDFMITSMKEGLEITNTNRGAHKLSKIQSMKIAPFLAFNIIKNSPTYSKLKVAITEGQNRELRRFFGYFDADVVDLKRVSFGGIDLGMLKSGKTRFLTKSEYHSLHTFLKKNV